MRTDRRALSWHAWLALAAALILLVGCPGKLGDKEAFIAAFNDGGVSQTDTGPCGDVVARIFVPSCGGSGCHGATAAQQDLDLVSSGVASRVVGVTAKGCSVTLVDPSNPEGSLMYQKLSPNPPCGAQMPLARPPLSGSDAACVLDWIAAQ